jgi:hypothetical protein
MKDTKGYLELIHKPYSQLLAKEIILAYEGNVTHQVMKAVTSVVEERLDDEDEGEATQRKVYHIMVECLQNINRHAEAFNNDNTDYPGRGAMLVTKQDEDYTVTTVNLIKKSLVTDLKNFLDKINPLSDQELNDLYKTQLIEGKINSKGGAGLGFIDIRRKTGNMLEYQFVDHDEENSFFIFKVIITR